MDFWTPLDSTNESKTKGHEKSLPKTEPKSKGGEIRTKVSVERARETVKKM